MRAELVQHRRREDDPLVELTARDGIAYVPYFPLGGFSPLQSDALETVARQLGTTPMAVALAWLLPLAQLDAIGGAAS